MNKNKIIILAITLFSSCSLFAKNGLELELNVPIGGSASFKNFSFDNSLINEENREKIKKQTKADTGFETGVNLFIGYKIDLKTNLSLSLLLDAGYNYDFLGYVINENSTKYHYWFYLHTLNLGIMPKINFGNFSFAIGAGVKIPFGGNYYESTGRKYLEIESKNYWYAPIEYKDLKNYFKSSVIPYIKLAFDYSIFVHKKLAITTGIYVGYDFMIETKDAYYYKNSYISSFDFGITVGIKFSEKNNQ